MDDDTRLEVETDICSGPGKQIVCDKKQLTAHISKLWGLVVGGGGRAEVQAFWRIP